MSETTKITETGRRGIESVNPKLFGQYDSIIALLHSRLGPEHAFLFAEPVPLGRSAKEGRDIAWFVPGTGHVRPLSELGDDSFAVRAKLQQLVADIQNLSRKLQDEGGASREVGRFLQDALVVPDDTRIWCVDGKPVLVDWGYRKVPDSRLDRDARSMVLGTGGRSEKSGIEKNSSTDPEDTKDRSSANRISATRQYAGETFEKRLPRVPITIHSCAWPTALLWLLFVAILVGIGDLLVQACAITTPSWARFFSPWHLDRCPDLERLNADTLTTRQIEADIRGQEAMLVRRLAACQNSGLVPGTSADAGGSASPPLPSPTSPDPRVPGPSPSLPVPTDQPSQPPITLPPSLPPNIKRGKIEVTLAWKGAADLDLFVICPDGGEISYRSQACGGELVADLNRNGGQPESAPIEHIVWGDGGMPNGRYSVRVGLFKRYVEIRPEIPYRVYLLMNGSVQRFVEGHVRLEGNMQGVFTFEAPIAP
jgi:hypothetical protein